MFVFDLNVAWQTNLCKTDVCVLMHDNELVGQTCLFWKHQCSRLHMTLHSKVSKCHSYVKQKSLCSKYHAPNKTSGPHHLWHYLTDWDQRRLVFWSFFATGRTISEMCSYQWKIPKGNFGAIPHIPMASHWCHVVGVVLQEGLICQVRPRAHKTGDLFFAGTQSQIKCLKIQWQLFELLT